MKYLSLNLMASIRKLTRNNQMTSDCLRSLTSNNFIE